MHLFQVPKMEEFLGKRDYTGAMAVLEFNRHSGQGSEEVCYMKFAQKTDSVSPGGFVAWLLRLPHGRLQTRDARI